MNRFAALVTIALLSSIATPFVVSATTTRPREAETAPITTASVVAPAPEAAEANCTRRVKVVYRGYGEGAANACAEAVPSR